MERLSSLREGIAELLSAGDARGAWDLLARHRSRLTQDRELALTWLELLRATPGREGLVDDAAAVLERWPRDPPVVVSACAALVAAAERRPPDLAPLAEGPAHRAAAAAARCLDALPHPDRIDPEVAGHLWIQRANALRLAGWDHDTDARRAFEAALGLAPREPGFWADLGLLHKWRGRWEEAADAFDRAIEHGEDRRGTLWNAALCATALGRGARAVDAWREARIPARLNDAGMPVVDGLEPARVRVPARGAGIASGDAVPDEARSFEIVWVSPLTPVHGVVASPTFRDAPVDWGDVILWDGAPVAVTPVAERPVPLFPLLEILRRGEEHRLRFVGLQQAPGDAEALGDELPDGCAVAIHSERVEWVCPRCASGDALVRHDHAPAEEHRLVYGKLVAPRDTDLGALRDALERAIHARGTVRLAIPELYERLGDTRRAGIEHQAWRGLERVALRADLDAP